MEKLDYQIKKLDDNLKWLEQNLLQDLKGKTKKEARALRQGYIIKIWTTLRQKNKVYEEMARGYIKGNDCMQEVGPL